MDGARYAIGIDLGTSNSVLAYVDLLDDSLQTTLLPVAQLDLNGALRETPVVPSMMFLPPPGVGDGQPVIGIGAKEQASHLPGRVIQSAKSWLCESWGAFENGGRILPWDSEEIGIDERRSPLEVSAAFLKRFKDAWDHSIGAFAEEYRFDRQLVTITVPASFDEMATKLTRDAADVAGFPPSTRLLEEPQAAFYCWLARHPDLSLLGELSQRNADGAATVLVCDVGGGTTDFSLFEVRQPHTIEGVPEIRRIAVSDHILLGGDNIDMALAYELAKRFEERGSVLGRGQLSHLLVQARQLKEQVLGAGEPSDGERVHTVSLPSVGSGLFRGALSVTTLESDVRAIVVEGFFPRARIADQLQGVRGGLQERGLPYARDSAVTRHLGQFLANAAYAKGRRVDGVLYAGGTLTPNFLRERVGEVIGSWQGGVVPREIEAGEMEVAVARGAAYYGGLVAKRRGQIRSAYARTLYVEVGGPEERLAVCVVPRGLEPEERVRLEGRTFELTVGTPVRFQLWYSSLREGDRPGDLVTVDESAFRRLPALEAVLESQAVGQAHATVPVALEAVVNQLGRLEMYFVPIAEQRSEQHFMLSFDLRGQSRGRDAEQSVGGDAQQVPSEALEAAAEQLRLYYGKKKVEAGRDAGPRRLFKELEGALGMAREEWGVPLLRQLWPVLHEGITRRGRSVAHEATWLSLAGFVLRPGYGAPGDDERITDLWRCYSLGLSFPKESSAVIQWWIMWRRVAGGLSPSAQREIFKKLRPLLKEKRSDAAEIYRLAASLEWLVSAEKEELGESLLQRLSARSATGSEHYIWALGRLGTRVPLYAPHDTVVSANILSDWLERVLKLDWQQLGSDELCRACSLACRRVNDLRDIDADLRRRILERMRRQRAASDQLAAVEQFVPFAQSDSADLFGEALPVGLRIIS